MQEKTLQNPKIRTSNIHTIDFCSVSYDIFGSPYQKTGSFLATDSLDFGYLGKPYNADTELYDYGFRDYSQKIARFTTVDPIRDGRNWYSYVVNDPVNYVDLWGLFDNNDVVKEAAFLALESIANGAKLNYAYEIYDTEAFAILLKNNTQYLDPITAKFVENISLEELVEIQNETLIITGVSVQDTYEASQRLGLKFNPTDGAAFSVAGFVFVFDSVTDYSDDVNKFLTKHEVIHEIQTHALGNAENFLTAYDNEYKSLKDIVGKQKAYFNISFEKGAYSFGPANSGAQSYYKEINEKKLTKGDEFCGSDKKD